RVRAARARHRDVGERRDDRRRLDDRRRARPAGLAVDGHPPVRRTLTRAHVAPSGSVGGCARPPGDRATGNTGRMTTELDDQRVLPAAAVTLAGAAAVAAVVAADPGGWYPFGTAKFTAVP